jgi:hypothetical protein
MTPNDFLSLVQKKNVTVCHFEESACEFAGFGVGDVTIFSKLYNIDEFCDKVRKWAKSRKKKLSNDLIINLINSIDPVFNKSSSEAQTNKKEQNHE